MILRVECLKFEGNRAFHQRPPHGFGDFGAQTGLAGFVEDFVGGQEGLGLRELEAAAFQDGYRVHQALARPVAVVLGETPI